MNYQRKTLLAGIAALALVAGTGLASAQETQGSQSKQPHATQQMNQAPGAKTGQSAQQTNRGMTGRSEQNAAQGEHNGKAAQQENKYSGKTAQEQNKHHGRTAQEQNKHNGRTAQQQNKHNGRTAEQRYQSNERSQRNGTAVNQQNERNGTAAQQRGRENNAAAQGGRNMQGMQGMQGNAAGTNVKLSEEQRTRIRNTVIHAAGAPRVGHVDFDVAVGTAIPRGRIHVIPVPETLVRIEPAWRGYEYFVYEDEVVIVNPNDMRIVAVVPA